MSKKWTLADMPDQSGKVAIVTGANSGLGFASANALAQKGAEVVFACRSKERGQEALRYIPVKQAQLMLLDLADLRSVKAFAEEFLGTYSRLDLLLNNAGIMATPYGTTADGFEKQIGVNHLGHFALTHHLLDCLKSTPDSRIVNVSSLAARNGQVNPNDFQEPEDYKPWPAYNQSKLANLMFTLELNRRLQGTDTIALAAHPGGAATNLGRHVQSGPIFRFLAENILLPLLPSAEQNAAPQLYACTAPEASGGDYYGPGGFGEISGPVKKVKMPATVGKREDWEELWRVSEKLVGVAE